LPRLDETLRELWGVVAAAAPNPKTPSFFLDRPAELINGNAHLVSEVWQKLLARDVVHDVSRYVAQPVRLRGIKLVHGRADGVVPIAQVRAFEKQLTTWGIEHVYVEHGEGHLFLPEESLGFLSERLAFAPSTDVEIMTAVEAGTAPAVSGFTLWPNTPNPFNASTRVTFSLPAAGGVILTVYDLRGQVVRSLVGGDRPAGSHEVEWDGRDQGGRAVASGIYLARLHAGGVVQARKMVVMR
jgi:hypothetical protein